MLVCAVQWSESAIYLYLSIYLSIYLYLLPLGPPPPSHPSRSSQSTTIIVGDFNNQLTPMDRSPRQKINKETQALNDTIDKIDLIDIYRTFIWSCRYLPCSFICNIFFCGLIFFDGWSCIPVLLVVWPEASSTGVCSQLSRVKSWCWDEDLQETSLQLTFPGVWGSLLVQRFGLGAPTTGAQAWPPAWEPRSHKPCGTAKEKKEKGAVQ